MMKGAPHSEERTAERREISVISCDLVESTALQERLGIERYRKIQDAFIQSCLDNAQSAGAETIRFTGDGLAFAFGRIRAFEYDAERAIKLALALAQTIQRIRPVNQAISGRFAIATGTAIVQLQTNAPGVREGVGGVQIEVVGPVLNCAARLLDIAESNEIVTDDLTHRLASGLFAYEDLGMHDLRGFSRPQRAWKILGENTIESRFHALRVNVATLLIGRDGQCQILRRIWRKVKATGAQFVLLEGEAGIGKSRLAQYFADEILDKSDQRVILYCNPHSQGANLAPVSGYLRNACGILSEDSEEVRNEKLLSLLTGTVSNPEYAANVLSAFLSNRSDGRLSDLSPQALRDRRLSLISEHFCGLSRYRPLCLIIEDIHWADRGTLALLQQLNQQAPGHALLVFATLRSDSYADNPEVGLFMQAFDSDSDHHARIELAPLAKEESIELVRLFFGDTEPDPEIAQQIAERADGNPLFIEDLSRCVLDTGDSIFGLSYSASSPEGVPPILWQSLMARLDRLQEAKRIAQLAAVVGREFSTMLLKQIAYLSDEALSYALATLCDAGIMQPHAQDACNYRFRHALMRDTAYHSLLEEVRGDLHWQVADLITKLYPSIPRLQPDFLALHYEKAAIWTLLPDEQSMRYRRAADLWFRAGQLSADRSEYEEALAHLRRAVGALDKIETPPDECERARIKKLEVMTEIVRVQVTCYGFSSPEVYKTLNATFKLCAEMGDPEHVFDLYTLNVGHHVTAGNLRAAKDSAEKAFRAIATESYANPRHVVIANRAMAGVCFLSGHFLQAIRHTNAVIQNYDAHRDVILEQDGRIIIDHKTTSLFYKQMSLAATGDAVGALRTGVCGIEHASKLGHSHSLAFAKTYNCAVLRLFDDPNARKEIEATLRYVEHQRFANLVGVLKMLLGSVLVDDAVARQDQDLTNLGMRKLMEGATAHTDIHAKAYKPLGCGLAAAAALKTGRHLEALRTVEKGLEIARATGEVWYAPELLRIKAECFAAIPGNNDTDAMLHTFETALAEAQWQEARLWRLRTCLSLCRCSERLGTGDRFIQPLRQIVDAFDDNVEFAVLVNARRFLADHSAKG